MENEDHNYGGLVRRGALGSAIGGTVGILGGSLGIIAGSYVGDKLGNFISPDKQAETNPSSNNNQNNSTTQPPAGGLPNYKHGGHVPTLSSGDDTLWGSIYHGGEVLYDDAKGGVSTVYTDAKGAVGDVYDLGLYLELGAIGIGLMLAYGIATSFTKSDISNVGDGVSKVVKSVPIIP